MLLTSVTSRSIEDKDVLAFAVAQNRCSSRTIGSTSCAFIDIAMSPTLASSCRVDLDYAEVAQRIHAAIDHRLYREAGP